MNSKIESSNLKSSCIYRVLTTYLWKEEYFVQGKVLWAKTKSELIDLIGKVHITLLHDQTNAEDLYALPGLCFISEEGSTFRKKYFWVMSNVVIEDPSSLYEL